MPSIVTHTRKARTFRATCKSLWLTDAMSTTCRNFCSTYGPYLTSWCLSPESVYSKSVTLAPMTSRTSSPTSNVPSILLCRLRLPASTWSECYSTATNSTNPVCRTSVSGSSASTCARNCSQCQQEVSQWYRMNCRQSTWHWMLLCRTRSIDRILWQ